MLHTAEVRVDLEIGCPVWHSNQTLDQQKSLDRWNFCDGSHWQPLGAIRHPVSVWAWAWKLVTQRMEIFPGFAQSTATKSWYNDWFTVVTTKPHNCFVPPFLFMEGLLSTGLTPSSFYLLLKMLCELDQLFIKRQHHKDLKLTKLCLGIIQIRFKAFLGFLVKTKIKAYTKLTVVMSCQIVSIIFSAVKIKIILTALRISVRKISFATFLARQPAGPESLGRHRRWRKGRCSTWRSCHSSSGGKKGWERWWYCRNGHT